MKLKFKKTDENLTLFREMGSRDAKISEGAQYAFARIIGPIIRKALDQAVIIGNLFETLEVGEDEPHMLPLDAYHALSEQDFYRVTMQSHAGGLASNYDFGSEEVPFMTYDLNSTASWGKKYARSGRVDVPAAHVTRMINELIIKREINSVNPVLYALANASTNSLNHVIRSHQANVVKLDDFVTLMLRASRIVTSFVGGTPDPSQGRGITDLIVSPEFVAQLRKVAYNPMNTEAGPTSTVGTEAGSTVGIPATDELRNAVFRSSGIPTFYDVNIIQSNEFGVGTLGKFNDVFDTHAGSTDYGAHGDGTAATTFTAASEEIAVGLNLGMRSLIKPIIAESETNDILNVLPDDQFTVRSDKVGVFGGVREGAIIVDDRALTGLIV